MEKFSEGDDREREVQLVWGQSNQSRPSQKQLAFPINHWSPSFTSSNHSLYSSIFHWSLYIFHLDYIAKLLTPTLHLCLSRKDRMSVSPDEQVGTQQCISCHQCMNACEWVNVTCALSLKTTEALHT